MVYKKNSLATESVFFLDEKGFLTKLPEKLRTSAEQFIKRNCLIKSTKKGEDCIGCCQRCLKAYLIENNNGTDVRKTILKKLKCEEGHEGYYIDRDELVEI